MTPAFAPTPLTQETRLHQLRAGQRSTLKRIEGPRSLRRRLMELGFLPGTHVEVVRTGGLGGLIEVEARSSRLGLRLSEAEHLVLAP
jgi:Fe2+ transport system protein FeoA